MELNPRLSLTVPCRPFGIAYGGGVNSTAMVITLAREGLIPDWITFSDTGCEKPETYETLENLKVWLGYYYPEWPGIVTVKWIRRRGPNKGKFLPLDESCMEQGVLPARAYGFSKCTQYYKIQPCDRWRKAHGWDRGCHAIGYDSGESRRVQKVCNAGVDLNNSLPWFPLYARGIDRLQCVKICQDAGIKVIKSSCYMCPAQSAEEWEWLRSTHPDLWDRSIEMSQNAISNGKGGFENAGLFRGLTRGGRSPHPTLSCTSGHCGL